MVNPGMRNPSTIMVKRKKVRYAGRRQCGKRRSGQTGNLLNAEQQAAASSEHRTSGAAVLLACYYL